MSARIGIAISALSVRAVAVRSGKVLWAEEHERAPGEPLASAMQRIAELNARKRSISARPAVVVALGPDSFQTKLLSGLPPVTDARVVAGLVRESSAKFFLKNGSPLATTNARVIEPGTAWAAAVDAALVSEIADACKAANLRLRAIVPAVAVLKSAFSSGRMIWRDAAIEAEVTMSCGELVSVRRSPLGSSKAEDDDVPRLVPGLAALGERAWRFADAYGAALLPEREPLAIRTDSAIGSAHAPRWRLIAAVLAFVLAALGALLAPGISATRSENRAAKRLSALAGKQRGAVALERELERTTARLEEIASFDATRSSAVMLLAGITKALPPDAAMVAIRIDSVQGTIVALAPRGAAVLGYLERVPGIATPEIIGPVTREVLGARELERVTVRFRLTRIPRTETP